MVINGIKKKKSWSNSHFSYDARHPTILNWFLGMLFLKY